MAELRVTYDQEADAAYVYFVDPAQVDVKSARTYTCDAGLMRSHMAR